MRKNCSGNQTKTTIELSPTHPSDSLLSSNLLLKILCKSLHKNYHCRYNEENRDKDAKKWNKGLYFSFKWLKTRGKERTKTKRFAWQVRKFIQFSETSQEPNRAQSYTKDRRVTRNGSIKQSREKSRRTTTKKKRRTDRKAERGAEATSRRRRVRSKTAVAAMDG